MSPLFWSPSYLVTHFVYSGVKELPVVLFICMSVNPKILFPSGSSVPPRKKTYQPSVSRNSPRIPSWFLKTTKSPLIPDIPFPAELVIQSCMDSKSFWGAGGSTTLVPLREASRWYRGSEAFKWWIPGYNCRGLMGKPGAKKEALIPVFGAQIAWPGFLGRFLPRGKVSYADGSPIRSFFGKPLCSGDFAGFNTPAQGISATGV